MMSIRLFAAIAAGAAALLAGQPAHADWESIHAISTGVRDRNCSEPHDAPPGRGHVLKSQNRPMRLRAGFSGYVEVFGQLIDNPLFKVAFAGAGSADPASIRRVSGLVNGARGCGAIGSFAVRITLPPDSKGETTRLLIGLGGGNWHADVPIEIVPLKVVATNFAPETLQGASTLSQSTGSASAPAAQPPQVPQPIGQSGGGCGPAGGPGCRRDGGAVLLAPGLPRGGASTRANLPDGIGGCIDNLGGRAEIAQLLATGKTLTISLPTDRTSAPARACLRRPFFIVYDTEFDVLDSMPIAGTPDGPDAVPADPPKYVVLPRGLAPLELTSNEPTYRAFTFQDGFLAGLTQDQTLVLKAVGTNPNAPNLSVVVRVGP
jgi:hypothetical protein